MNFKVSNLSKYYHNEAIIKHFNYEFSPGLYLFTGYNGSGKSTTLKLLAGVIHSSNYTWSKSPVRINYLCEKIELSTGKVEAFLKLICRYFNQKRDIKSLLELWQLPNKKMAKLSKGNKQKVGIIMTMIQDSDVYLFDEATDALDQRSIELFTKYLKSLVERQKIVILVTHEKSYFKDFDYQEISFDKN